LNRIIIAYARNASREKIAQMLSQISSPPVGSFRSGAEVIENVNAYGADIVICGYQLSDMTADDLVEKLGSGIPVLVAAAPASLEQLRRPDHHCLSAPFSAETFARAIHSLISSPAPAPTKYRRPPEEVALITRAKELLISRGMTEPEAHAMLQQRSMRERCKLTLMAQRVLEEAGLA